MGSPNLFRNPRPRCWPQSQGQGRARLEGQGYCSSQGRS
ncbi:hypothetical protein H206_05585 [Candidatus Electrothrix aarhusensis]|uniref:Uncharacterized protein n=1 Tax=Candidatus Electrothrix aarhusensis TaxID=1859131 RepID=A0A3S3QLI5_9BACT|nr:hypothetical protein H206_05585 [Candidatus Electrothrix aarhusensis]